MLLLSIVECKVNENVIKCSEGCFIYCPIFLDLHQPIYKFSIIKIIKDIGAPTNLQTDMEKEFSNEGLKYNG